MNQEELLFFASSKNKVNFISVPTKFYDNDQNELEKKINSETLFSFLSLRFGLKWLGEDYKKFYLPCTPAHNIQLKIDEKNLPICSLTETEFWKKNGLIKVNDNTSSFSGYKSGKRSSIIPIDSSKALRLKGCGNELEGFVTSKGKVNLDPDSLELRGCHYQHTVRRELYMTKKIEKILEKYEIPCGNKSLGFWKYFQDSENEHPNLQQYYNFNLKNECVEIDKYCGVFETIGEKRLSTHLFQGLEKILFELIQNNLKESQIKIKECFPIDRILCEKEDENDIEVYLTPLEFVEMENETFRKKCDGKYYEQQDFEKYVDPIKLFLYGQISFGFSEKIKETLIKISNEANLEDEHLKLYNELITNLLKKSDEKENLLNDVIGIFSLIFARIGYELGRVKKIFILNDINWGYYIDHHPYLAHCNAHPNNFVVLSQKNKNFIAPLDFDLAFQKDEFINIDYESKNYGKNDKELFDSLLYQEKFQFELSLTGIENMDNFQYYKFYMKSEDASIKNRFEVIKTLLRDCLRMHYMKGFDLEEFEYPEAYYKHDKVYALVKMALILTDDHLA